MTDMYIYIASTEYIHRHCTRVAGGYHGSAWLFDKVARFFDSEKAAESITMPVFLNAPLMCEGEATIHRDGRVELRRI